MQTRKNSAKSLTVFSTSIRTFLSPRFICFRHIVCIYNSSRSFSMQKLAKMFTNAIEYFHYHSRIMTQTRKISACKYTFTFKDNVPCAASWPNNWLFKSFERFGLAACFVNICFVIQIFGSTLSDCTLLYFTVLYCSFCSRRNLFKLAHFPMAPWTGASAWIERSKIKCCSWKFGSGSKVSKIVIFCIN